MKKMLIVLVHTGSLNSMQGKTVNVPTEVGRGAKLRAIP